MAGTIIANSVQPDVGTNLYLDATQGNGKVIIGNTTTTLMSFDGTGKASSVSANNGLYSSNNFTGTYTGGVVVDYTSGRGRISVGSGDALTIYNGGVANTALMTLDSSGNLGLGVTPSAWWSTIKVFQGANGGALTFNSGAPETSLLSNGYYTGSNWIYSTSSYASRYAVNGYNGTHTWYNAPSGTAGAAISFTQAMTLDASGNLGIGTTSPNNKLQVVGAVQIGNANTAAHTAFTIGSTSSDTGGIKVRFGAASTLQYSYIGDWYTSEASYINFFRNNGTGAGQISIGTSPSGFAPVDRVTIDSSGNLLVGMTSQGFSQNGFNANISQGANIWGVGVGGNSVSSSLTGYSLYSTSGSAYKFYVQYSGNIYATSTTITAISDQRLKENIRDLDDGLSTILALKPRKFDWKEGKGKDIKDDRGFIAQEFEQVFPDLIDTWKDPAPEGEEPYKSVRPDLIPIMVKAIQELSAELNELKQKVNA